MNTTRLYYLFLLGVVAKHLQAQAVRHHYLQVQVQVVKHL